MVKKKGGIICEGWRDGWRNASVNPCVRAAAQCQVSACEWACVTAVSPRPGRDAGRWERKSRGKPDNRNVFMSVTEQQAKQRARNTENWRRCGGKKKKKNGIKCQLLPVGPRGWTSVISRLLCPEREPICREFVTLHPPASAALIQSVWHLHASGLLSQYNSPTHTKTTHTLTPTHTELSS